MSLATTWGRLNLAAIRISAVLAIFAFASACTNFPGRRVIAGMTNPNESPGTGSSSFINLLRVLKSAHAPLSEFDLLGDGTGQIGQYCIGVGAEASCQCRFRYVTPGGSQETLDVDPSYSEADLLRCPYSQIQSGVSSIDVSIYFVEANKFSNTFTYSFPGGGSLPGGGDPTQVATFIKPLRYQCRDILYIPYLFERNDMASGAKIYDPFQSENGRLTYPLNFYTSNLARAIGIYANTIGEGGASANESQIEKNDYFECALNPAVLPPWANLRIYSQAPDSGGSFEIFPGGGSTLNRSDFLLARSPTGVFTKAVNARFAPASPNYQAGLFTQVTPPGQNPSPVSLPPIGYAAQPVGESCPNVPIPAGHRWVKLWQFQAALPERTYVWDSDKIDTTRTILCDPGTASEAFSRFGDPTIARPHAAIPDCSLHAGGTGAPIRTINASLPNATVSVAGDDRGFIPSRSVDRDFVLEESLAPRAVFVVSEGEPRYTCFDFAKPTDARTQRLFEFQLSGISSDQEETLKLRVPSKGIAGGFNLPGGAAFAGADTWMRVGSGVPTHDGQSEPYRNPPPGFAAPFDALDELQTDIPFSLRFHPVFGMWDMHIQNYTMDPNPPSSVAELTRSVTTLGPRDKHGVIGVPYDNALDTKPLDGVARFDYLLVASPPEITISQMQSLDPVARPYIPFRYKTNEDCILADPSTCGSFHKIGYSFEAREINGGSGGVGPPVFPLCAIQPIP
jgi:hypothetical protein